MAFSRLYVRLWLSVRRQPCLIAVHLQRVAGVHIGLLHLPHPRAHVLQKAHDLRRLLPEVRAEVVIGDLADDGVLQRHRRGVPGPRLQKADDVEEVALPQGHYLHLLRRPIVEVHPHAAVEDVVHTHHHLLGPADDLALLIAFFRMRHKKPPEMRLLTQLCVRLAQKM